MKVKSVRTAREGAQDACRLDGEARSSPERFHPQRSSGGLMSWGWGRNILAENATDLERLRIKIKETHNYV